MNGYRIGDGLVRKLGETIRTVDSLAGRPGGEMMRGKTRFDDAPPPAATFRIGTCGTAAWTLDSSNTVTLTNVGITGQTVLVTNVFGALGTSSSSRICGIAREGTAWYLIQARCP